MSPEDQDAANPQPVRTGDLPDADLSGEYTPPHPTVEAVLDAVLEQCGRHGVDIAPPLKLALIEAIDYELTRHSTLDSDS